MMLILGLLLVLMVARVKFIQIDVILGKWNNKRKNDIIPNIVRAILFNSRDPKKSETCELL